MADWVAFIVYGSVTVLTRRRPKTRFPISEGAAVGLLFAAGLVTARLAGATHSRQAIYVIALPSVGLVIVGLEVAAQHV